MIPVGNDDRSDDRDMAAPQRLDVPFRQEAPMQPTERGDTARTPRRGWSASSIFFLALSVVLAVLALLLATGRVRIGPTTPPPPPPMPGQIQVIDVVRALEAQGLAVEQLPRGVPRGAFSAPGQALSANGTPLYLFIFPDPATAEREVAATDPFAVLPAAAMATPGRTEIPAPDAVPPMIVRGSNVAVAMPGGDDDLRARVRAAIEGLPT